MLRITTKSKLPPKTIIQRAIDFFGPKGNNLKIVEKTDSTVKFESVDGVVDVSVESVDGKTSVDLFTNQWEFQTREFIDSIKSK